MARKAGLLTSTNLLNYSEVMSRLEREAQRANKLLQCADVLQELQSMAAEWATDTAAHEGSSPAPTTQHAAQPTKGKVPNPPGKKALAKIGKDGAGCCVGCDPWHMSQIVDVYMMPGPGHLQVQTSP